MKNKILIVLVALIVLSLLLLWFVNSEIKFQSYDTEIQVGEARVQAELSRSTLEKYKGLSGRESMCSSCGMLFIFDEPQDLHFVMRGMKFPLDFAFIRDGEVVEIFENIPFPSEGDSPLSVIPLSKSDAVLELNAGFIAKNEIKVGDRLSLDSE